MIPQHTALHEATRYAEENLVLSRERAALVARVHELELERARVFEGLMAEHPPAAASPPSAEAGCHQPAADGNAEPSEDDDGSDEAEEVKGDAGAVTAVEVERPTADLLGAAQREPAE